MREHQLTYLVNEIPDRFYPQYEAMADGDVLNAAGCDFKHLLQTLSNLPPHSVTITIRLILNFKKEHQDNSPKLSIFVIARIRNDDHEQSIRILLEKGPISRFYKLQKIEKHKMPIEKLAAVCEIIRRENAVKPLHTKEFNVNIPQYYYTIQSFEPNDRNDFVDLDRALGDIRELIVIDIGVEPIDIATERSEHIRYLSQLQSINNTWMFDEDTETEVQDYLGDGSSDFSTSWRQELHPLRYRDPLADDIFHSGQRFNESLQNPHLLFNIKVFAQTPEIAKLICSIIAKSSFDNGSYRLFSYNQGEVLFDDALARLKDLRLRSQSPNDHLFHGWNNSLYSDFKRLALLATVDELSGVFRLPVASATSPKCIRKNTDPAIENTKQTIPIGRDLEGSKSLISLKFIKCCNHGFISGVSGTGKTTSIFNLLLRLHQKKIPFMVIEPAKTEYRILKTLKNSQDKAGSQLAKALQIYTVGDESISPLRLNPLWLRRPGISINEHIDNVLACFMASMPVAGGPLPALLGEALERVYEDHPDEKDPPILSDLITATEKVLSSKGYSADTNSDIRSALEVRLGMLTRRTVGGIFQSQYNIPGIDHLMKVPSILELDHVHPIQACLVMLFLLMNVREYFKTVPKIDKTPRFVIIIEEAHNIVGRSADAINSADIADPKSFAAEYVCRMLAEMRALGVGIFIVDQLPSAVAPEVIKSTATKLSFRQIAREDREDIGATMLFGQTELDEIARLPVGIAFFYTEGFYRSRRIKTENLYKRFNFKAQVYGETIIPYLKDDNWFLEALAKRSAAELDQLKKRIDQFNDERLRINKSIVSLLVQHTNLVTRPEKKTFANSKRSLGEKALSLQQRLNDAYASFLKNPYSKYFSLKLGIMNKVPLVEQLHQNLIYQFENVIKPDVRQSLKIIAKLVQSG